MIADSRIPSSTDTLLQNILIAIMSVVLIVTAIPWFLITLAGMIFVLGFTVECFAVFCVIWLDWNTLPDLPLTVTLTPVLMDGLPFTLSPNRVILSPSGSCHLLLWRWYEILINFVFMMKYTSYCRKKTRRQTFYSASVINGYQFD